MSAIRLRFTRSFYVRQAFVGGLLAFLSTMLVLTLKHAGPLVNLAPVLLIGPWLFFVLREYFLSVREMDDEAVTRRDGRRFLWQDFQRLQEMHMLSNHGVQGPLNNVDLLFTGGRARILHLVLENGLEAIQFARGKAAALKTPAVEESPQKPGATSLPATCPVCGELGNYHSATQRVGHEEDDTWLPAAGASLKVVQPVRHPGHGKGELKQCPHCRAWFFYRSSYEYLATGSEDEQILIRLSGEEAEKLMQPPS